jgi:NADH:ubiquinone oxidoreductase subunit 6 (subunit J)
MEIGIFIIGSVVVMSVFVISLASITKKEMEEETKRKCCGGGCHEEKKDD